MTQPISRRTVAKAGVWSAPVVAASAAVPAYAASKETPGVQYRGTLHRLRYPRL